MLDEDRIIKELDQELSGTKKFREPPSLLGRPKGPVDVLALKLSRVNWRIALPLLFLAILAIGGWLGYKAWHERQTQDPFRELGPGLYQAKRPGETIPLATNHPAKK